MYGEQMHKSWYNQVKPRNEPQGKLVYPIKIIPDKILDAFIY